jgi:hypothetical protein
MSTKDPTPHIFTLKIEIRIKSLNPDLNLNPDAGSELLDLHQIKKMKGDMARIIISSVADSDTYVFGSPGSGSGFISQKYGSGFFYHQSKIGRKTLLPTVL